MPVFGEAEHDMMAQLGRSAAKAVSRMTWDLEPLNATPFDVTIGDQTYPALSATIVLRNPLREYLIELMLRGFSATITKTTAIGLGSNQERWEKLYLAAALVSVIKGIERARLLQPI